MPAYRSPAEAEIRDPVVARLRDLMPGCRIIHEINASGMGSNRIDVLAVSASAITAVEVKSRKDTLERLPDQIMAMRQCAGDVVAALDVKFFDVSDFRGGKWAVPDWRAVAGAKVWGFGFTEALSDECDMDKHVLRQRHVKPIIGLPAGAIRLLWRDELREIVSRLQLVKASSGLDMAQLAALIRWHLTGADQAKEICAALRARRCVEADPEITP